jgi:hypothetical protein
MLLPDESSNLIIEPFLPRPSLPERASSAAFWICRFTVSMIPSPVRKDFLAESTISNGNKRIGPAKRVTTYATDLYRLGTSGLN